MRPAEQSESASTAPEVAVGALDASVAAEPETPEMQAIPVAPEREERIEQAPLARDAQALERDAQAALAGGDLVRASAMYSDLVLDALQRDDVASRELLRRGTSGLASAQRGHRWNKRGPWPSVELTVESGDSLTAIRKRALTSYPDLRICTGLIARANELDDEKAIHPKDKLRIPTDKVSVLVDLSAMWVVYLHADQVVAAWEVGVGKDATQTKPGSYVVGGKQKEPMWFPAGRAPVPFGDHENPLGTRWLAWHAQGVPTSLGFHGTNDPSGIGKRVSEGCIRMRNVDVEELFEILPEGSTVVVQP